MEQKPNFLIDNWQFAFYDRLLLECDLRDTVICFAEIPRVIHFKRGVDRK
jgi:hypothetical protein